MFFVFLNKHDPCGFSQGEASKKEMPRVSKKGKGSSRRYLCLHKRSYRRGGWRGCGRVYGGGALGEAEVPFTSTLLKIAGSARRGIKKIKASHSTVSWNICCTCLLIVLPADKTTTGAQQEKVHALQNQNVLICFSGTFVAPLSLRLRLSKTPLPPTEQLKHQN